MAKKEKHGLCRPCLKEKHTNSLNGHFICACVIQTCGCYTLRLALANQKVG